MLGYQLLRPFAYLSIKHPQKWKVDWLLPIICALISVMFIVFFREGLNFFGPGGFISLVLGYVQNLPGFYIAALAAIATFGRNDIDVIMPGNPPPKIEMLSTSGVINLVGLTRRRFLCLLFAFLTAECVILTLGTIGCLTFAPIVKTMLPSNLAALLSYAVIFFYFLFLYQLLIATLWGLYYLGDRIHQPDS